ncbi:MULTISPECIES: hypothetical protein [unclassified Paenibacillus]|nr:MULTISPECIES: hypothetical protein [unclassified Paenibacillus]EPY11406.1 hypothetical protein PAAL66ix_18392 [Paenibacillus alvei A6-6i-x]SDF66144.1 hypothetical protein SAMN04488689_106107 [Paenibacillus sp. cl6col]
MPFLGQTVVASNANTYVAPDQLTAINLAVTGAAGNRATVISQYPVWPNITKYSNDTSGFGTPEYIWDSTTTDNQVRAFAAFSGGVGSEVSSVSLDVSLTVFADNAHVARLDVYDLSGQNPAFITTLTPPVLTDGSMDANTGLVEILPYNWQNIRIYNISSNPLPAGGIYGILASFTVVNYLGPNPPVTPGNPAGLMFYANINFFN